MVLDKTYRMTFIKLHRRVVMLGLFATPALFLTACGGTAAPSAKVASLGADVTAATTTITVNTQGALLKFAKCMRDNGVDMKDPTFDAQGNPTGGGFGGPPASSAAGQPAEPAFNRDSDEFQKAQQTCRPLLAGIGFGGRAGGNRPDRAVIQAGLNDFTKCLRTEGLQVDDITFGPGRNGQDQKGGTPNGSAQGAPPDGGPDGGQVGPPPSGAPSGAPGATTPDGPGFKGGPDGGPPRDGKGFDPTSRIMERLNLDTNDPKVSAAVDKCKPVLTKAFTPPSTTVGK
jgi:hypothetical protein